MKLTDINKETAMKPRHIMAPQNTIKEALWNSTHDRWSRNAKHPLRINEREIVGEKEWEQGDIAIYEEQDVEIKIPHGPDGTVGIILEGKLKMVLSTKLTESAMGGTMGGIQAITPINRMMQLAGLSPIEEKVEDNTNDVAHYTGDELPQKEDQPTHSDKEEKVDESSEVTLQTVAESLRSFYDQISETGGKLEDLEKLKGLVESLNEIAFPKQAE